MQQRRGHLGKGVVHLIAHSRLIIGSQPPLAHMANYAHHQSRSGAHGGNPDALANCVFAAEGMLGEILVDHDHRFTTDAIVFIEEATVAQRNAHHFQVVRRYTRRQRDGLLVQWRGRGGGPIRHRVFSFAHRDNISAKATDSTPGTRRARSSTSCQASRTFKTCSIVLGASRALNRSSTSCQASRTFSGFASVPGESAKCAAITLRTL